MVRSTEAAWRILAGIVLLWGSSCAPALHATAVKPFKVRAETSYFESGGHRIRVDEYRPRLDGPLPSVIVIHGSSGVHRIVSDTATRYARALAEQGLNAFVVHYFDSTGTIIANLSSEEDHYFTWAGVLKDAVTWVIGRPDVDASAVSILGHSLGAFLAVGVAAADPRVSRVVLFGGGLETFLPEEKVQRMPPTMVFHGDSDEEVPLSDARHLVDYLRERRCDVELRVLPGEGHIFSESAVNEALTEVARFFTPALRSDSTP